AVMCVFSPSLLRLWLGESYTHLAPLMVVMLCHLTINVGVLPIFNIQVAMNKVRTPALVTLAMGVANMALAILLVTYFKWGAVSVAAAGGLVLTAKHPLWTPWYASTILSLPSHAFVQPYLVSILLLTG